MAVLQSLLNIIIFLISLSIIVSLHEFGHFSTAKIFNVYCDEFSIGFGPKIIRKKFWIKRRKSPVFIVRENEVIKPCKDENFEYVQSETYFSIRVLPLGGYVSMAGEGNDEFEDKKIPIERTIPGINHFKQIIIFLSGVFTNFVLAISLFFCNFAFVKQVESLAEITNEIVVSEKVNDEDSLAVINGLKSDDRIIGAYQEYHNLSNSSDVIYFPYNGFNNEISTYAKYIKNTNYYDVDCIAYNVQDIFLYKYYSTIDDSLYTYPKEFESIEANLNSYRIIHLKVLKNNNEIKEYAIRSNYSYSKVNNTEIISSLPIGISAKSKLVRYSFTKALGKSFSQFGYLFVQLYKALFSIFTPKGWNNVGGIISVYKATTTAYSTGGISSYLFIWGYISLNLGCFNLLPFPALDGFQTLIAIIESIRRKKISQKTKGVLSAIGLIILFAFAGALIIKDIIMWF